PARYAFCAEHAGNCCDPRPRRANWAVPLVPIVPVGCSGNAIAGLICPAAPSYRRLSRPVSRVDHDRNSMRGSWRRHDRRLAPSWPILFGTLIDLDQDGGGNTVANRRKPGSIADGAAAGPGGSPRSGGTPHARLGGTLARLAVRQLADGSPGRRKAGWHA